VVAEEKLSDSISIQIIVSFLESHARRTGIRKTKSPASMDAGDLCDRKSIY
jgi:hypothetical protein